MIWPQDLPHDLGMPKYKLRTLFCDNQGTISLAKNPTHHVKKKHVDVHSTLSGIILIDVEYCPTVTFQRYFDLD